MAVNRLRDSQKQKVYDWDAHFRKERLTLEQCQDLVDKACAAHGIRTCQVIQGRANTSAFYLGYRGISLPTWAQNKATVLHEVAHAVIDRRFSTFPSNEAYANHGPEFARVLLELLAYFNVVKVNEARKVARDHKVKISSDSKFKPRYAKAQVSSLQKLRAERARLKAQLEDIDRQIAAVKA